MKKILLICLLALTFSFSIVEVKADNSFNPSYYNDGGTSYTNSGDCNGLTKLVDFMRDNVYKPIKIAAPVLFVLLTTLDFANVVITNPKDGMEKAKKKFINRAIACVLLFFIPYLLDLILTLLNDASIRSCLSRM